MVGFGLALQGGMAKQNVDLAVHVTDRRHVLQTGRVALEGRASDLLGDARIRDAYLGGAEAA